MQYQWDFAIAPDIQNSVEQAPNIAAAHCNRGFAYAKKAQWDMAIADYDKAISIDPALDRSRWNKKWAYGMKAQWDHVITDYTKIIEPSAAIPSTVQSQAGECNLALSDYAKAIALSNDPALTQRAKDAMEFIEQLRKLMGK
ncbi:MAG: tetratricopeptide repeat protein [Chloroflexi bacterium]|nr:tetratricopeptide repeat protein [Chloroflexota bacterium]